MGFRASYNKHEFSTLYQLAAACAATLKVRAENTVRYALQLHSLHDHQHTDNVVALIIRRGFGGILYYNHNKQPQNPTPTSNAPIYYTRVPFQEPK